jgi:hypothetical protein
MTRLLPPIADGFSFFSFLTFLLDRTTAKCPWSMRHKVTLYHHQRRVLMKIFSLFSLKTSYSRTTVFSFYSFLFLLLPPTQLLTVLVVVVVFPQQFCIEIFAYHVPRLSEFFSFVFQRVKFMLFFCLTSYGFLSFRPRNWWVVTFVSISELWNWLEKQNWWCDTFVCVRVTYPSLPFGGGQTGCCKERKTTPGRKVRTGRERRLSALGAERERESMGKE